MTSRIYINGVVMRTNIKLGKVFGIEIGLHYSWFLIAIVIVFSLGGYFRATNSGWSNTVVWSLAVLTGLLFFVSLVAHELSHSLVAKARKLPVRAITLFALGGVSQIEKGANNARTEFWMAIAGPAASMVIGLLSLAGAALSGWHPGHGEPTPLLAMLVWLGYINIALAVFNMIPGYPLDGGRVLRSLLWWKSGDANRSERVAARTGQVVGAAFIAWGLFRFFTAGDVGGLWIAFIGWFLIQVAGESYAEAGFRSLLAGVRVGDVMNRDCPVVDGYIDIQTFVTEVLLHTESRSFVVQQNGVPVGILSPADLDPVPRGRWPFTTLSVVMRPLDDAHAVAPETPVTDALALMTREHANQLPVVSQGHLDGILSKRQVARFLGARAA